MSHTTRRVVRTLRCCLWLVAICLPALGQLSPGPLSSAHRALEGVTKCVNCHDFGAGARGFKCLECHGEIKSRVEGRRGYHSRVYKTASRQTDCARCHMEHNGEKYSLVRLERKGFDHRLETGFVLEGKHKVQRCESCHAPKHLSGAARAEIKLKDLTRSFLGLRRECTSCHVEPHGGKLGADCLQCHTQEGWKPAPGFLHAKTKFPLTGMHQAVACQKCHVQQKPGSFSGVVFTGCQSCHKDPHRGAFQEAKFRGSCNACHGTSGWKKNQPSGNFDHNLTKFKLVEKHGTLACAKCHRSVDFHLSIQHERCQSCHEDPHNKQFASRAAGSDCSSCHNQTQFKATLFNREMHQGSAFPLTGKHASVDCAKCHQPEGKQRVYITGKRQCAECHEDRHKGAFTDGSRCDSCHTVEGFKEVKFDRARHQKTKFPLTGKHMGVECGACHKESKYRFESTACQACHKDPHETKLQCETCHNNEQWKPARSFDHGTTKFRIEYAHLKASCIQCHKAEKAPRFAGTQTQCAGCHEDKRHGGQFKGTDCSNCHSATLWKEVAFDHDRARFPLDRAHRNVACAKCHKPQGEAIRYRGTSLECTKCH